MTHTTVVEESGAPFCVPLSEIVKSGNNPREELKGDEWDGFVASVKAAGIIEPLVVRSKDDKYELVAGERRLTAAKQAGMKTVPIVLRELSDEQALEFMLTENLQRKDLTPLEEATAVSKMLELTKESETKLAARLGKGKTWVAERRRLMGAPDELKQLLEKGALNFSGVMMLLPLTPYPVFRGAILSKLVAAAKTGVSLSEGEVEHLVWHNIKWNEGPQFVLCLSNWNYESSHLKEHFDASACPKCPKVIKHEREQYCLDRTCWADKLNIAKQAFEAAQAKKVEKLQKGEGVSTKRLEPGTYEWLEYAGFDTRPCKKCDKCKVDKSRSSTIDGGRGGQRLICLNPSCFRGKKSAKTRAANKRIKSEKVLIRKCFTVHAVNRKEGMTAEELRFVLQERSYSFKGNQKLGTMSVKELENLLLGETLRRDVRDNSYTVEQLRSLRRRLPFKVNEKLAKKVALEDDKDEEAT